MLVLVPMLLIVMLRVMFFVTLLLFRMHFTFMLVESPDRVCMAEKQFGSPMEELARLTMPGAIQSSVRPPEILVIHTINLGTAAVAVSSPGPRHARSVESLTRGGVSEFVIRCRGPSAQKSALGFKLRLVSMLTAATVIVVMFMVVQIGDAPEGYRQSILPTRRQRAKNRQRNLATFERQTILSQYPSICDMLINHRKAMRMILIVHSELRKEAPPSHHSVKGQAGKSRVIFLKHTLPSVIEIGLQGIPSMKRKPFEELRIKR